MRKGPQSIWEIVEASKDALPCLIFSIGCLLLGNKLAQHSAA